MEKLNKTTFIYALTDPNTNQVRYIGKSNVPDSRWAQHIKEARLASGNTRKLGWIRSLIKENKYPVLEILDEVEISEWGFWERYYYYLYKSWGFNLTNSYECGVGVSYHSKEMKEVFRKRAIETCKRGKDHPMYGKGLSKESLEKRRRTLLERYKGNRNSWKLNPNPVGLKRVYKVNVLTKETEEVFDSIKDACESIGMNQKKFGEYLRGYMSQGTNKPIKKLFHYKGYRYFKEENYTKEAIESLTIGKVKKVTQYDMDNSLLARYTSIKEASEKTNINMSSISACAAGKQNRAGGYIFRYEEES